MNAIVSASDNMHALLERVLIEGDLSKLNPQERLTYYSEVCRSAGLNPLTKPFAYLQLNGKLQLYALKSCTDQLRMVHGISVESLENKTVDGVYVVTAKVKNDKGRTDVDDGAVNTASLKGEVLANAMMKATTKAKRRATLSLCGLGLLDESEVDSISGAVKIEPPSVPQITSSAPVAAKQTPATPPSPPSPPKAPPPAVAAVAPEPHDPETGEVGPREIPVPVKGGKEGWVPWGKLLIAAILASDSPEEIDAWRKANADALERCEKDGPKAYASIHKATTQRVNQLFEGPGPTPPQTAGAEAADWMAELDSCTSEAAVEDLRERAKANMFPGDLASFKQACADKATALFNGK